MSKKTIIIICSSVLGLFLIIILAVWLISSLKPKYISYEQIETKMKEAAEKYYKDNAAILPSQDGTYSIDYSILSGAGYIKPLTEQLKDGATCSGNVTVIIDDSVKTFIPYLNCGEKYLTRELYKQILNDNPVVTEGRGLYLSDNGEYYFRGKIDNNYVVFGSTAVKKEKNPILWRIISINNNNVKLKAVKPFAKKTNWDDRYNTNEKKSYGYNDFELSILKEYLTNESNNSSIFKPEEMTKLVKTNLCVGKRSLTDTSKDGSVECSVLSNDQYYFGTITPYEYIRASLDDNCLTADNRACSNLNHLFNLDQSEEWSITADNNTDYNAFVFSGNIFSLAKAKTKKDVYPTIILNNYTFYKSGSGNLNDPYIVK